MEILQVPGGDIRENRRYFTSMALLLSSILQRQRPISAASGSPRSRKVTYLLEITFTFKVDGAKLTGTAAYPLGDDVYRLDVTDGKVEGDDVSFTIASKFRDTVIKSVYKGKVAGDEIEFHDGDAGRPGRRCSGGV